MRRVSRRWFCFVVTIMLVASMAGNALATVEHENAPGRKMAIQATQAKPLVRTITADHTQFEQLKFTPEQQRTMKPEAVTMACLGCHNQAALQFHQTIHWTWRDMDNSGEPTKLGKGGTSVNNF